MIQSTNIIYTFHIKVSHFTYYIGAPLSMSTKSFYSLQSISKIDENVHCQLLEIDSYKILLNIGSDKNLNISYYNDLENILDSVDCILICHAELKYIGGLLHFYKKFKGKIITTLPVQAFGRILLHEISQHLRVQGNERYTFDDIEECFNMITDVKYSQPVDLGTLRIIAQNSGHSLGGALWQIQKEREIVTIALNINHKKENHIDGCDFTSLKKSFLFITDCNFVGEKPISRKKRDNEIHNFLEENSENKIIFICSLMRSLELCCVIDAFLETKENIKCSFLSYNGMKIHETIKGLLEWTGDLALKKFTSQKVNPFKFENINFLNLYSKIDSQTNIFIILDENFESVFTKRILYDYNSPKNVLCFLNDENEELIYKMKEIEVPNFISPEKENVTESKILTEEHVFESQTEKEGISAYVVNFTASNDPLKENIFVFPYRNKQKPKDIYGEYLEKSIMIPKKNENEEKEQSDENIDEIELETIKTEKKPFSCDFRTKIFNFNGIIDGNSMKDIIESINIEKLILFGSEKIFVDFFHDFCSLTKSINEIVVLQNQKVNLSTDTSFSKVDLDEKFLDEANLKDYNGKLIAPFVGEIKQNVLYYKRPLTKSFLFGNCEINTLSKQFLDQNLRVRKIRNQVLLVEDCVEIRFEENQIWISGDFSNEFLAIREIVYNNFVFIE